MPWPLSLLLLLRVIKPWDKDAVITISIEEATFGIAFDQLMLKDDITQVCKIQEIGVMVVTLYVR